MAAVPCPNCGHTLDLQLDVQAGFELRRLANGALAVGPLVSGDGMLRRQAIRIYGTGEGTELSVEVHTDLEYGSGDEGIPVAICRGPDQHVLTVDELGAG